MKKLISQMGLALTILLCSHASFAQVTLEQIKGSWLGTMHIPQGPSLRIGVEVFKKADNSWGGNIASLDQGARYMLVSNVSIDKHVFTLQMAGAPVSIVGNISDDKKMITAKFNQSESAFELVLEKVAALPEIERAQTPAKKTSYLQQAIRYKNLSEPVWLSGTLTLPKGDRTHPAVMLVAGSGPNHRDSYHAGHRTFKVLADHLTKQGYIVLRSDKRGVYQSSGDYQEATLNDLVSDTQAAVHFLKSHQRVDANNIILIGHSEGSLVSVMAAEQAQVQGVVSLAGPGMSVLDILLLQDQTEPAAKGASKAETDLLLAFSQRFYQMVLSTPNSEQRKQKALALYANVKGAEAEAVAKWVNKNNGTLSIGSAQSDSFYQFLQQSPIPYWNKFSGKALVLNGDKDSQVPAQSNVTGIVKAINNQAVVQSKVFVGLNHLFQPAVTGSVDEYKTIEKTIDEQVLTAISQWLGKHFN